MTVETDRQESVQERVKEDAKTQILDAAMNRFARFGFGKTTMAEIAKECDMSAGNLYRYYDNKAEIGAGCAERCMRESEQLLREVVDRPGLNPRERLKEFVLNKLTHMHEQLCTQEMMFELVQFITQERYHLVEAHKKRLQALISEILAEGNRAGVFKVDDVVAKAAVVENAAIKFLCPYFLSTLPLDDLRNEALQVVDLIIDGLSAG